jgi:hypothetical protein
MLVDDGKQPADETKVEETGEAAASEELFLQDDVGPPQDSNMMPAIPDEGTDESYSYFLTLASRPKEVLALHHQLILDIKASLLTSDKRLVYHKWISEHERLLFLGDLNKNVHPRRRNVLSFLIPCCRSGALFVCVR